MAIYTIHVPDDAPDAMTRGERTIFIREGFSARAFLFGLFYLLWHRLWSASAVWILLLLALAGFAVLFHPPAAGPVALLGLMHLYLGAEGPDLRRWGLSRRGYVMRDLVSAPALSEAETLFFTRLPDTLRSAPSRSLRAPAWGGGASVPAVIGVFPDGEGA